MGEDADDESLNKLNKEDMISEMKKIGDMWPGSKDDVLGGISIALTGLMETMDKQQLINIVTH
jgi:BRCT domain type II-containing protein